MKRQKGIGGTDISAITGMNPWKTPLDVWLDKTGQSEPTPDNEIMWWGREMEPVLKKRYEQETGLQVYVPPMPYHRVDIPWYLGSPDGLINLIAEPQCEGGVDFKTSGQPQEWGKPGTDAVPQHYVIQAEWYMGLTGAQWWDIAVLLMGFTRKFAIYRITRDQELIDSLTEAGAKFWQDHVLAKVAPTLDGSKSATEYLKRKFPQDSGPMLEPTDEEILTLIRRYAAAKGLREQWEEQEARCTNEIKAIIGDCAGLKGEWGKITWKKSKDSTKVDWEQVASWYENQYSIPNEVAQNVYQEHTIIKPGSRRFLPKFKTEE